MDEVTCEESEERGQSELLRPTAEWQQSSPENIDIDSLCVRTVVTGLKEPPCPGAGITTAEA